MKIFLSILLIQKLVRDEINRLIIHTQQGAFIQSCAFSKRLSSKSLPGGAKDAK